MTNVTIDQQMQHLEALLDQNAPMEQIEAAESELAESIRRHPYELKQQMPRFMNLKQKLDARIPFQQFRLPGGRIVKDRREPSRGKPAEPAKEGAKQAAKGAAREAAKKKGEEMVLRKGKLVKEKGRAAGRLSFAESVARGGLERGAAADRVEKLLSAFERMVLDRFERGREIAQKSADGKAHFAQKSEAQWKQFFKSFLHRTIKKKTLLNDIKNFLFRGAVAKGGKGVFIGDMTMSNGRVQKFVRFSILAEALAKLANMRPGEMVGKDALGKLTGEELMYLALAAARAKEFTGTKAPEQGKFISGRAEAEAARALGIPLDQQLREKARRMRRGGGGAFGGDLLGEEGPFEELPYRFVPWWHWGNLTRPGKFRWTTLIFYGSLLVIALLGIALLTYRMLSGG